MTHDVGDIAPREQSIQRLGAHEETPRATTGSRPPITVRSIRAISLHCRSPSRPPRPPSTSGAGRHCTCSSMPTPRPPRASPTGCGSAWRTWLTSPSTTPGSSCFTQGSSGYIYQPGQQLSYGTARYPAGNHLLDSVLRADPHGQRCGSTQRGQLGSWPRPVEMPTWPAPSNPTRPLHRARSRPSPPRRAPLASSSDGRSRRFPASAATRSTTRPLGPRLSGRRRSRPCRPRRSSALISHGASGIYAVSTVTASGQTMYNAVASASALPSVRQDHSVTHHCDRYGATHRQRFQVR